MGKTSGGTRTSSSNSPKGLNAETETRVDLASLYRSSGMLDMDYSKAPKITEADFTEEDQYSRMTKPMELDVDIDRAEDRWAEGLTGGESGAKLRETKRAIADAIKGYSGEELNTSNIDYDKNLKEFVAYHKPNKIGDVAKSYWKIDRITQTVRFAKSKRTGFLSATDKWGNDLYSATASHNYTIKVKNTGTKEY